MNAAIPSVADVRCRLMGLTLAQIDKLSELSKVPTPTLHKIRYGQTVNPGIETVRQFLPHIEAIEAANPPHEQAA